MNDACGSEAESCCAAPLTDRGPEAARRQAGQIIGWSVLALVAGVVLLAALGERLGVFDQAPERLPWGIPDLAIALGGWPVLRAVARAASRRHVTRGLGSLHHQ